MVSTIAPKTFREFIQQRARWGGKSLSYRSLKAKALAVLVATYNTFLVLMLIGLLLEPSIGAPLVLSFILKIAVDYLMLSRFGRITDQRIGSFGLLISSVIYPFYILITGIIILFSRQEWKGRAIRPAYD